MEARLTEFIASAESLANLRNLDPRNPIFLAIEHPVTAQRFTVVCSIVEPSYIGVPMNCTWIVLDPKSPYFRRALKLREDSWVPPDDVKPVPIPVEDADLKAKWYLIREYAEIFADPQYQVGSKGEKGDKGDKGEPGAPGAQGEPGPAGVVDYDRVRQIVEEILNGQSSLLFKTTTAQVYGTKTFTFAVELKTLQGSSPVTPVWALSDAAVGSISAAGLFTAADLDADKEVTLTATYNDNGTQRTATHKFFVRALRLKSLTVNGAAQVGEGKTSNYTATATMTDNTTKSVTPTWSVQGGGSISAAGVFTAPTVAADTPVTVKATFTEKGVTVNGQLAVTVKDTPLTPWYGAATLPAASTVATWTEAQWQTFIEALQFRGPTATKAIPDISICCDPGSGKYLWYCAPVSFGTPTFVDKSNGFTGGWDGAKSNGNGAGSNLGARIVNFNIGGVQTQMQIWRTDYSELGCPPENQWEVR